MREIREVESMKSGYKGTPHISTEKHTAKRQFRLMSPGETILLVAIDNMMVVECQRSCNGSMLLYRPPTEEEKAEAMLK